METTWEPGRLLAQARRRAGLSQRELAQRAGTSQSVVARIERGQTDPGAATLDRLLAQTGFELHVVLRQRRPQTSHMLDDVARILGLTPEERLREVGNAARFVAAARRA
jgi:transcriptional regulator with XRE-family HTH domain